MKLAQKDRKLSSQLIMITNNHRGTFHHGNFIVNKKLLVYDSVCLIWGILGNIFQSIFYGVKQNPESLDCDRAEYKHDLSCCTNTREVIDSFKLRKQQNK